MLGWSGKHDPLDPRGGVNLLDIVIGLGREPRFSSFGDMEWTVLHHSFFVFLIYLKLFGRAGSEYANLHDAHEAYPGDIPKPVKEYLRDRNNNTASDASDPLADLERDYDVAIAAFLGIPTMQDADAAFAARVKLCDRVALVIEARLFGPPGSACWTDIPKDDREVIKQMVYTVMPDFDTVCRARGIEPFPQEDPGNLDEMVIRDGVKEEFDNRCPVGGCEALRYEDEDGIMHSYCYRHIEEMA